LPSWQKALYIHWLLFLCPRSFVLYPDVFAGFAVEVVIGVFTGTTDQQVFLFIYQGGAVIFANFEIRG